MTIHFPGSIHSIAMLELSIEVSSNPLIEVRMHCTKLSKACVEQRLEALVYVCYEIQKFIKFAHIILMHWHVISITCKMTHELLASNTHK